MVDLLLLRSALASLHALGSEVYQAIAIFKKFGFPPFSTIYCYNVLSQYSHDAEINSDILIFHSGLDQYCSVAFEAMHILFAVLDVPG